MVNRISKRTNTPRIFVPNNRHNPLDNLLSGVGNILADTALLWLSNKVGNRPHRAEPPQSGVSRH